MPKNDHHSVTATLPNVRFATWNILHGRDYGSGSMNFDAVAAGVAALDADVVALQEVDRELPRSGGIRQIDALAHELGYAGVFAPALLGVPGRRWEEVGDTDPGGPAYGIGLLSRHPITRWRRIRLPGGGAGERQPGAPHPGVDGEPRTGLLAELSVAGRGVTVVATHLSYMPWRGALQLASLLRATGRARPAVLLGDLNLPTLPVRAVARGWRHSGGEATYPSDAPRVQIDHILVRGAAIGRASVADPHPSDHRPLVAQVTLRS